MKRYHLTNNILGWLIGIFACAVYIITAEATASWWDCGEFIATAQKLEVGHPPGAPTFQLIGRLFGIFAEPLHQAYAVNVMSAICSGLGIMFLFWTITLLGKKLLRIDEPSLKDSRVWGIFAAGIVGSLAYTFSDTYWFSAVEGEVYAMSSFFTAVVFWAVLKWEEQSDDPRSLRWLVLICFLVGLAIGVHLLNLLTIPAIVYVVYFKKWANTTRKGFIWSGIISVVMLAVVLYGVIPGIVNVGSAFDVFFVNKLHLPFNTGVIFFFALLAAAIAFGLWYTSPKKKNKPVFNAGILGLLMIIIGYSTFFILIIRANTNTPLNENCPRDAVALRAYLGREQYGQTPLITGQYYTAGRPVGQEDTYTKYVKGKDESGKDRYVAKDTAKKYVYNQRHTGFFPRMWSDDNSRQHPKFYKYWAGEPPRGEKPTMGQNIRFFNRYQCGFMYWRYFMWNFAGRQNDIQGHYFNDDGSRDYLNGNWISGIKFIDEMRLGPQSNLTDDMLANKGRNTYFLLPLLLGLAGLIYHCKKNAKDAFIVFVMFFMTGLAIEIYLNMPPRQPRERDYAFVGSFYFFCVWVGLGVMGISEWISDLTKKPELHKFVMPAVFVLCLLAVPVRMCSQNWDDHDRSQKTAARDFARNYLNSTNKNSILITFGDNDTFPLWYAQEVEGVRTDVRILNYTLAGMHWYIEQLYNKLYESDPLPLTLPYDFYELGRDIVMFDNSSEVMEVTTALEKLRKNPAKYLHTDMNGSHYNLPTSHFKITLDLDKLVKLGVITAEEKETIDPVIRFDISNGGIYRHELMMLDLIGTNRFERDITIMNPGYIKDPYPIVNDYCVQDGMLYKLTPYKYRTYVIGKSVEKDSLGVAHERTNLGRVNYTKRTADFFLNGVFNADGTRTPLEWGNLNMDIYVDPISSNMGMVQRQTFFQVAEECFNMGDKATAQKMLDLGETYFPTKNFAHDKYCVPMISVYMNIYGKEKAVELWNDIFVFYSQELNYLNQYTKAGRSKLQGVRGKIAEDANVMYGLSEYAKKELGDEALAKKAYDIVEQYASFLYQYQM